MENVLIIPTLLPLLLAYLLGSVPYGLVFATKFCGIDPRTAGSGNVGATNVARLCGKGWGVATLLCDLCKGALSVVVAWYAITTYGAWEYTHLAAGFLAIIGHMFPVFLHFKGGKGVATTVGVFLVLCPIPFVISAVLCLLIIWRTGFVSVPILTAITGQYAVTLLASFIALIIIYAHRENIKRLIKGEEKAWNVKRS